MALGKREVSAHHRFGKVTAIATTRYTLGKFMFHFQECDMSTSVSHFRTLAVYKEIDIFFFEKLGMLSFDK